MGSIYRRGKWLWLGYKNSKGKWVYRSTGLKAGEEAEARRRLRALEAGARIGSKEKEDTSETVESYGLSWCKRRIAAGNWDAKHEQGILKLHLFSGFGHLPLAEIRPSHIRELMLALSDKGLAGRTRHNIYGMVHRMFADAAADEVIAGSPCVLRRGELPKRVDKNPLWRATAVFTRNEVERLISDTRIDFDRRLVYGLGFLGGLREGEIGALRWRAIDTTREPLGVIQVVASYNRLRKEEKRPKSGHDREVPIHPALAKLVATWRLQHPDKPDALVVPGAKGSYRTATVILRSFKADLDLLGMTHRRFHDTRRTFISLAMGDGARKDVLRRISHGASGDVFDQYNTPPWVSLCEAVTALRVEILAGDLLQMPTTKRSQP